MKKPFFTLAISFMFSCIQKLIIGLSIMLISCEQKPETAIITTISGEIINPEGNVVSFSWGDNKVTDTLDSESKFSSSLSIDEPTEMRFNHGDEYSMLYLRPGDQLNLTLDTRQFDETLVYSGTGAEINNYKAAMVLLNDSVMGLRDLYMLPEDRFLLAVDSISALRLSYLDNFNIADEKFLSYTRENAKWEDARNKIYYEGNHKYLLKLDSFKVAESFYDFQESLDINDTTQLQNQNFRHYVSGFLRSETSKIMDSDGKRLRGEYYAIFQDVLFDRITHDAIQREILYDVLNSSFGDMDEPTSETMFGKWKALNPSEEQLAEVSEKLSAWSKLTPGKPAPSFRYASIDGDTLELDAFKGKLVYIDVWATWCGPCIAEHPAMEKLQERFEGEDVAFVAISIDNTPGPWKKMIENKKLGGVHLYASGAWQASIMKDYMIRGIPRFILIDREGKIIDSNATRPSGDIGDQIEELLKPV